MSPAAQAPHAFQFVLETGAAPTVAQGQLRHADPRITLGIYGHIIGESQRIAAEKWPRFYAQIERGWGGRFNKIAGVSEMGFEPTTLGSTAVNFTPSLPCNDLRRSDCRVLDVVLGCSVRSLFHVVPRMHTPNQSIRL